MTGTSKYLRDWMMRMPPAQDGTTYFNFIASHDGIGLRPVEGLLDGADLDQLIATLEGFGGLVSRRQTAAGESRPMKSTSRCLMPCKALPTAPTNGVSNAFCVPTPSCWGLRAYRPSICIPWSAPAMI